MMQASLSGNRRMRLVLKLVLTLGLLGTGSYARASCKSKEALEQINRCLQGHVVDYTHNHGCDRRVFSPVLGQKRDLYVYLPPGFDPGRQYPAMIWLHGFGQDETSFLEHVVKPLDRAISEGCLPPLIVAAPDGSLSGEANLTNAGSFFINSKAGRFEDYIIQEVWPFVRQNYPIRPEREAHVLAGVSMGGGGAFNLAIKFRDQFKVVVGIFPPLNIRWVDCHGRYMANFDPCCWGWKEDFTKRHDVVGRFYGVVFVPLHRILKPLFEIGPNTAADISQENPIEMIDRLSLQNGELSMYIAYGGKDQFNLDAQVESFLYRAKERGLEVSVGYLPHGKHDAATALQLMPGMMQWLGPQLEPYRPKGP